MKNKILVLALTLLFGASAFAQTQKGSVLIGGLAGFTYNKYGEAKVTTFEIAPMAHFFVIDQLAVGGSIAFRLESEKFGDGDSFTTTGFGVSPAVRYYFTGDGNIRPFAAASFAWASVKPEGGESTSVTGFGAGIGADFFLNDRVAIEGVLSYQNSKVEGADESTNSIGLNFGVVAFIGGDSN